MSARPIITILDASTSRTGALVAAKRQAAALADLADFILVLPASSSVRPHDVPEFKKLVYLPMVQLRRSIAAALLYIPSLLYCGWKLRRLVAAERCTRLQINDFYLMQGAAARLFGYRGVLATWIRIDPVRFGRIGRLWLTAMARASNELIAVSRFIQRQLGSNFNAQLVYDPYPHEVLQPAGPTEQRLVFIGNYIEGKGQDHAIRAFSLIADRFPGARLELYGGDMGLAKNRAYRERLERQAAESGAPDRICIGRFVEDSRVVLAGARAALTLSASESFSLTCQEASACGVAVIATRCGGPEEIVLDGQSGFLVDVGDVEATASSMAKLLADPTLAAEMGLRGAQIVGERFTARTFRERMSSVFELAGH